MHTQRAVSVCCPRLTLIDCLHHTHSLTDDDTCRPSLSRYMASDDSFNWNHGIALAATKQYKEAEEALLTVSSERFRHEYCYLSWLARCHIQNGKPRLAWEL